MTEKNNPWENQPPKITKQKITNEIIEEANKQGRRVTAEELGLNGLNLDPDENENMDRNNP
jgi:hypothetical protein